MPFHNATTTSAPKPKRTTVKKAKKPSPYGCIPVTPVTYQAPEQSGLNWAGALVDPEWVKAYEQAHPTLRGPSPLGIAEEIASALRPLATESFNPDLILHSGTGAGAAKAPSGKEGYAVEVMEGFETILQAVAATICDLHNGRLSMKDIGATQDEDGTYSLEDTALERHLSDDLVLAMRSFRIAAEGVAEGFDREDMQNAIGLVEDAACARLMEEPELHFDSEELLDIALDGYDNMEIEALALDLLERVRPGSMRKLNAG